MRKAHNKYYYTIHEPFFISTIKNKKQLWQSM